MRILICAYRTWAKDIYHRLAAVHGNNIEFILVSDKESVEQSVLEYNPKYVFFLGWSWIIPEPIVINNFCICLHPSPLPRYRGGSPIQNQIINNERESAVTLFKMDKGIDTGDVLYQEKISLEGSLKSVFLGITEAGTRGISRIIDGDYILQPQTLEEATTYKRRTPEMSEIKVEDFKNLTSLEIYNKIRCLQDPYPNPYIVCKNGTRLYLKEAYIDAKK